MIVAGDLRGDLNFSLKGGTSYRSRQESAALVTAFPMQPTYFLNTTVQICWEIVLSGNETFLGFSGFPAANCSPSKKLLSNGCC